MGSDSQVSSHSSANIESRASDSFHDDYKKTHDHKDGHDCKITHSKGANSIPEKDALNPIHDPEFKKLRDAALSLLESSEDAPRQYYYVNLMKLVKTYTSKTSFGELALLTDKRRKAKLETR